MKRLIKFTIILISLFLINSCTDIFTDEGNLMLKKGKPVKIDAYPCLIQINPESDQINIDSWENSDPKTKNEIVFSAGREILDYYGLQNVEIQKVIGNTILCIVANLSTEQRGYFEHGLETSQLINADDPEAKNDHILWAERIMSIYAYGKPINNTSPVDLPNQVLTESVEMVLGENIPTNDFSGKRIWILDSGVAEHEDLNVDHVSGISCMDYTASTIDDNGHGTHVAGIAAALDNQVGIVGVAPGATIIPVKILDKDGRGSRITMMEGIDHVSANCLPGDVILISCGEVNYCGTIINAVEALADAHDVKIAIPAGNQHFMSIRSTPVAAKRDNIFGVSACDINGNYAYFSAHGNDPIEICAPGMHIVSTHLPNRKGNYLELSGTSMAAAHVAGLLLRGWDGEFDYIVCEDPDDMYDVSDGEYRHFPFSDPTISSAYHNNGYKDPIAKFNGGITLLQYKQYFFNYSDSDLPENERLWNYKEKGMPAGFPTYPAELGGIPYEY